MYLNYKTYFRGDNQEFKSLWLALDWYSSNLEINETSLLNRVKSTSKNIQTILTESEIEEIRITSTKINNQLLTFMGFITMGFLAALLLNIVNIDSGLITSFTTSIISIDVALLFSNIVSRQKKLWCKNWINVLQENGGPGIDYFNLKIISHVYSKEYWNHKKSIFLRWSSSIELRSHHDEWAESAVEWNLWLQSLYKSTKNT